VLRCLALRPEDRPASATVLARELAASIDEPVTELLPVASGMRATEVLPATTTSLRATRVVAGRTGRITRRRVLVAVVAAAVLVGIAAALDLAGSDATRATTTPPVSHPAKAATQPAKTTPTTLAVARTPTGATALAALDGNVSSAVAAGMIDPGSGQAIANQAERAVSDQAAGGANQAANDLQQAALAIAAAVQGGRTTQAEGAALQADLSALATALGVSGVSTPPVTQPGRPSLPGPKGGPGHIHGHGFGHGDDH
jgi:hypothetical protein